MVSAIYTGVPGGKVNILGGHSIGHSKKKVYMSMYLMPNGFRYLVRSILNWARNIFHHNSQLTLYTDSHASDSGALRLEGRKILLARLKILRARFKILCSKYRKPFGIGHMFI
jgi:hypothetical protein